MTTLNKEKEIINSTEVEEADYKMYNFSLRTSVRRELKKVTAKLGIKIYSAMEQATIRWIHEEQDKLGIPRTNFDQ